MIIVATWKVFLVSCGIVGTIIYNHLSEIPCPKKYMDKGGEIVRYCKLDYDARWVLKDEYKKSDMER